jgi:tellurite resistance protein TerA
MQLSEQDAEAELPIEPLTVTMQWSTGADFDLAAVYETDTGTRGLVYFGDFGAIDKFPYIRLSRDQGVGDKAGDNKEVMSIHRLDRLKFIWLFCWDYHKAQNGEPARFANSDLSLQIKTQSALEFSLPIPIHSPGNVCCLATIDNQNALAPRLINKGMIRTLNGLKTLSQLMSVLQPETVVLEPLGCAA